MNALEHGGHELAVSAAPYPARNVFLDLQRADVEHLDPMTEAMAAHFAETVRAERPWVVVAMKNAKSATTKRALSATRSPPENSSRRSALARK